MRREVKSRRVSSSAVGSAGGDEAVVVVDEEVEGVTDSSERVGVRHVGVG